MNEQFDAQEMQDVAEAMRRFHRRCEEIMRLLDDKQPLGRKRTELQHLYSALKGDIKEAAKYGTLSGQRRQLTRVEECFYYPAIRRAAIDLKPATNSHPVNSRWFSAVYAAQAEFSHWLHNMGYPPRDQV